MFWRIFFSRSLSLSLLWAHTLVLFIASKNCLQSLWENEIKNTFKLSSYYPRYLSMVLTLWCSEAAEKTTKIKKFEKYSNVFLTNCDKYYCFDLCCLRLLLVAFVLFKNFYSWNKTIYLLFFSNLAINMKKIRKRKEASKYLTAFAIGDFIKEHTIFACVYQLH